MRTLFTTGIQNPREVDWMRQGTSGPQGNVAWMGQAAIRPQTVYAATFGDIVVQGFQSAAQAYGSYGDIQEAEAREDAKRAEADTRAAEARIAQINQQTALIQQQAGAKQNQIMGIDKTAFFVGATLLGLLAVGGTFFFLSKK